MTSGTGAADSRAGATATRVMLVLICALGAYFRFTGLGWGAPYFPFHMDEHYVFMGADTLRRSIHEAAMGGKFFMYGPLPMWTLDAVRWVYEHVASPLVLTLNRDEIRYMVMGRAISATFGTALIPVTFLIAKRIAGRVAGLIAALLIACAVVQLRESHFFSVDTMMLAFVTLAFWFALRVADRGRWLDLVLAGASVGAAAACKYSALFVLPVLGVAYLVAPGRPAGLRDARAWLAWIGRGLVPLAAGAVVFAVADPIIIKYWPVARADIKTWVIDVNRGISQPIFMAQFRDVQPQLYWFTNILWWGLGPALEMAGLAGVGWLLWRRDRLALVAAAFPIAYYASVAQVIGPFMRYGPPFALGLSVAAAVMLSDWIARPRLRRAALALAAVVCGSTALYGAAYLHIFRSPDVRLTTSAWMIANIPKGADILVEPTHNLPPTGAYLTGNVDFYDGYTMFGRDKERRDYYNLYALDTYDWLYKPGPGDLAKFAYIQQRLAKVDWIVLDDTYVQFYQHLPAGEHAVVKRFYRDLFAGRLGFQQVQTFKVYPSLFGVPVNDDAAELSFRLFDHPRLFVFKRTTARAS